MAEDKKTDELKGMEITSLRTAEQPGPILPETEKASQPVSNEAACCQPDPQSSAHNHDDHEHEHEEELSYLPAIISLVLLLSGLALNYFQVSWFGGYLEMGVFLIAYALVGWKVLRQAALNIFRGEVFNEFFLMGIATLGALYLGEYAEAVAVMLFYVIGEHFQEAAVARSRKSIKDLIDNRPELVNVL